MCDIVLPLGPTFSLRRTLVPRASGTRVTVQPFRVSASIAARNSACLTCSGGRSCRRGCRFISSPVGSRNVAVLCAGRHDVLPSDLGDTWRTRVPNANFLLTMPATRAWTCMSGATLQRRRRNGAVRAWAIWAEPVRTMPTAELCRIRVRNRLRVALNICWPRLTHHASAVQFTVQFYKTCRCTLIIWSCVLAGS